MKKLAKFNNMLFQYFSKLNVQLERSQQAKDRDQISCAKETKD